MTGDNIALSVADFDSGTQNNNYLYINGVSFFFKSIGIKVWRVF